MLLWIKRDSGRANAALQHEISATLKKAVDDLASLVALHMSIRDLLREIHVDEQLI